MQSAVGSDQSPAMDAPKQGLPVTIITGFLGSGKTTLLNHILTNQQGLKTAVLVNEFGEIGIDNELIVTTGDDMVELSNGCICCTINNDLVEAVYKVLERPEKVDYLVVETTGVADPLPVALTFLGTELRDMTRLDSIITVVDAANYSLDLFNSQAAYSQIAYGDVIILNKADLVEEADLDLLEVKIRDIKDGARILRTTRSQVPLPLILSVGLFESDKYFDTPAGHDHHDHHDHSDCDHDHHDHHDHHDYHDHHDHHDHHHHHSDHLENDGFTSISFQSDKPLAIRKFQYFLDNQLPENIFRAKGIMWFEESPKRHIFHLCGKRFTLEDEEWNGKPKKNQLVLIGQNLDREALLQQLQNCICLPSTSRGKGFSKG
ncbi:MAG: putative metal chaperone YciC [Chroococcidiopsis cubana SAG 39.79]|uniref:GTP-binding protein n=1 Tax=Chroococcidiopsis cubana SAG 39.79 TaxID=388085 RepID=A0AB37UM22_9CYAN|nr:GTP-binding protein [Chroococcidiopsis cubana]MDZ4875939.1 putative metal chaperone YciC [Chroococcidiopsis cubana SAG 39.79]PSB61626.1 cobalamin biosynthesis protein CobW [Chroococcidiopsis cubana CCALA 043]RUT12410.1 GTP-binding protein [Chroococcidiopsis cubana SAG 39.79]